MTPAEVRQVVRGLPARTVLGLTLWGECRGEPRLGQVAVAWVVKNRASRRRQSVQTVCLAKWQFSCWWEESPNAAYLRELALRVVQGEVIPNPRWLDTLQVAYQVLEGAIPDPTLGSDHYLTTQLYESDNRPAWASAMPVMVVVGRHVFLSDNGSRRA